MENIWRWYEMMVDGRAWDRSTACEAMDAGRWKNFVTSLSLDCRVDFEEGDIGLAGGASDTVAALLRTSVVSKDVLLAFLGIKAFEPALEHPVSKDGPTSAEHCRKMRETLQSLHSDRGAVVPGPDCSLWRSNRSFPSMARAWK